MDTLGTAAALIMPLFNIPMIIRLLQRKRSDDISLFWTGGVWLCTVLMTPRAIGSADIAFKLFGLTNIVFFSAVAFLIFYYRVKPKHVS